MQKLRQWRIGVSAIFVVVLAAVVYCYSPSFGVHENYDRKVEARAGLVDSWLDGNVPYVKARVDGYTGWVEGSAQLGSCFPSYCAYASAVGPYAAGGTFTGRGQFFINNQFREERVHTVSFQDDPPEGGDCEAAESGGGYCGDDGSTPILIPTGKSQALKLTSPADGVVFDILGNGAPVQVAWTAAGSEVAFLALDRNQNGVIDSGAELFGDHTLPGVGNGFHALRLLVDQVDDGKASAEDQGFVSLLLWTDRNHNGYSELDELEPASNVLEAVGLGYTYGPRRDGAGNEFKYQGWARKAERPGAQSGQVVAENIVWGTAAAESEIAREFKIYDVILRIAR
jgi:hypothetical protein